MMSPTEFWGFIGSLELQGNEISLKGWEMYYYNVDEIAV